MKSCLCLLAALLLGVGQAWAQAGVSLYGVVDLGLKYERGAAGAGAWSLASGQRLGSRIGLRGSEDLGGGTRLAFTLESGINADDGTLGNGGRLFGRQAWVGLEGPAGAIHLGRQYSATYLTLRAIDPFKNQEAGDTQRIHGFGIARSDPLSRVDRALTLSTPTLGGLAVRIGHGFSEGAGPGQSGASSFAGLSWAGEALQVHAGLQHSDRVPLGTQAPLLARLAGTPATAAAAAGVRNACAGLVYRFGKSKLHAGYGAVRVMGAREVRSASQLVGATVALGPGTLLLSWNRSAVRAMPEATARQLAAGYAYPLGRRTELYASGSRTRHAMGARSTAAMLGNATDFRLGIAHQF